MSNKPTNRDTRPCGAASWATYWPTGLAVGFRVVERRGEFVGYCESRSIRSLASIHVERRPDPSLCCIAAALRMAPAIGCMAGPPTYWCQDEMAAINFS